jgi:hypothetical protein
MPEDERFRGTLRARAPDGGPHTLIVLRRAGRVWCVLAGAEKLSAVMTDDETEQLIDLLRKAMTI